MEMQTVTPAAYRRLAIEIPLTAALAGGLGIGFILGLTSNIESSTAALLSLVFSAVIGAVVRTASVRGIRSTE